MNARQSQRKARDYIIKTVLRSSNEVISTLDQAECETYQDLLTLEKADFAELTYRVSNDDENSTQRRLCRMDIIKLALVRKFIAAVANSIGQNSLHECDWLIAVTEIR